MLHVEDLEFHHFNTGQPLHYERHCESAFRLWETEWNHTFKKANFEVDLYSDDFLHRELGGLFLGGKAIGFLLYTFFDLARYSRHKTLYFKNYPRELWAQHCAQNDLVMVPTYMTLDPTWRRSQTNFPISEMLFSFSILRLLESSADRMIAYARNDLKMNEGFYRHGGHPVLAQAKVYNTSVDFIEISRANAHLSTEDSCAEMALMQWNKNRVQINPHLHTVLQKREGKNHVITLYQQEDGKNHSSPRSSAVGEQGVLPGLARANLLLHPIQHSSARLRGGLVTD